MIRSTSCWGLEGRPLVMRNFDRMQDMLNLRENERERCRKIRRSARRPFMRRDAIGRRTEIARSGSRMTESRSDAYGYNDRSELTNAVKNATLNEYAYQYDDIGNRPRTRKRGIVKFHSRPRDAGGYVCWRFVGSSLAVPACVPARGKRNCKSSLFPGISPVFDP